MRDLFSGLFDLFLPPACAACGRTPDSGVFCRRCSTGLPRIPRDLCVLCQEVAAVTGRCAACSEKRWPLAACVADVRFESPVEGWIRRFKYPRRGIAGLDGPADAAVCALIRAAALRAPGPPPERILPVPLHRRRLRSRGFNPAAVLARAAAREVRRPFDAGALTRVRDTPSQTGRGRTERRRNVAGAFAARPQPAGGRVWLVDDVVTTGSTLREAAGALRHAGWTEVIGVCAARTAGPG